MGIGDWGLGVGGLGGVGHPPNNQHQNPNTQTPHQQKIFNY